MAVSQTLLVTATWWWQARSAASAPTLLTTSTLVGLLTVVPLILTVREPSIDLAAITVVGAVMLAGVASKLVPRIMLMLERRSLERQLARELDQLERAEDLMLGARQSPVPDGMAAHRLTALGAWLRREIDEAELERRWRARDRAEPSDA